MIFLGLTGSIGMGKTTAVGAFASFGIPVFEADAVTHDLLGANGAAAPAVAQVFPEAIIDGVIDRERLGNVVFRNVNALRQLEAILHPLIREEERKFRYLSALGEHWLAVLDIPLLFETGANRRFDYTAVVTAPASIQRARVLRRTGMTVEKFEAILARQISDRVKRRKADFVIDTSAGKRRTLQHIRGVIRKLRVSGKSHKGGSNERA